jgi:hypothetical protein
MRKILRYTKLLIVSTLLTASFGLTTEAVRSQPYPSTHYSQGIADDFEGKADRASDYGDSLMSQPSYNNYIQAKRAYEDARDNYINCLKFSHSRNENVNENVVSKLQYVRGQLNSLNRL